jgi:hypothetical protein
MSKQLVLLCVCDLENAITSSNVRQVFLAQSNKAGFGQPTLSGISLKVKHLTFPSNIKLGLKGLSWTDTLAYYEYS